MRGMKLLNKIILLKLVVLLPVFTFASSDIYNTWEECYPSDPDAKMILDQVKERYSEHENITLDFTLEVHLAERPKTSEKGRIVQQGEMFKIEMNDQDIYCDGADLWYYLKGKNEVQINDYEGGEDVGIISPSDLLEQYESGSFEYALFKEYEIKGKSIAEIEFLPNDSFSDYSKLRVVIDKEEFVIKEVYAFGKDGSRFNMSIDSEDYEMTYGNEFFKFDKSKFPDVLVEDLRLD